MLSSRDYAEMKLVVVISRRCFANEFDRFVIQFCLLLVVSRRLQQLRLFGALV